MLAKKFKIGNTFRVEYIRKKGRRINGRLFRIRYLPNRHLHNRFACVISKQTSRLAVKRNTLRRRIYEAIRKSFKNLPPHSKTCYDVVVLGSESALKSSFADIVSEIAYGLKHLS